MNPPPRRRAAAVSTVRPGAAPHPAQEQQDRNTAAAAAALPATAAAGSLGAAKAPANREEQLKAYVEQRKLEREQKRAEEAAALRAERLAAAAHKSGKVGWNPAVAAAPGRPATSVRSAGLQGTAQQAGPEAPGCCGNGSVLACARSSNERQSISSAAPAHAGPAAAALKPTGPPVTAVPALSAAAEGPGQPPPLQAEISTRSLAGITSDSFLQLPPGEKWSPRKQPRPLQQQASSSGITNRPTAAAAATAQQPARPMLQRQLQQAGIPRPAGRPGPTAPQGAASKAAGTAPTADAAASFRPQQGAALPAAAVAFSTAEEASARADSEDEGAELDSAELEARRIQQLVGWGTVLVQAGANVAAERLLLGPAALPDSQPPTASELPISFGMRPPKGPEERAAAVQHQVARALQVLEQQRQIKLQLLEQAEAAAAGPPGRRSGSTEGAEQQRRLLAAEAAADLQAQALLAHWGMQAASEARRQQQQLGQRQLLLGSMAGTT